MYLFSNNPLPNLPPWGKEFPIISPLGETGKGVKKIEKNETCTYLIIFLLDR